MYDELGAEEQVHDQQPAVFESDGHGQVKSVATPNQPRRDGGLLGEGCASVKSLAPVLADCAMADQRENREGKDRSGVTSRAGEMGVQ